MEEQKNHTDARSVGRKAILFICGRDPQCMSFQDGGAVVTRSNYEILSALADVETFSVRPKEVSPFEKVLRIFFGMLRFAGSMYPWTERRVKKLLAQKQYEMVFIDHSLYGRLARTIRKKSPKTAVFTHFHNIESVYQMTSVQAPWVVRRILAYAAKYNEMEAVKHSNRLICLTETDSQILNQHFRRRADHIVPISLSTVDVSGSYPNVPISEPYLLFCGSKFGPNLQGIKWFVEKVMPALSYRLVIVGQGMDQVEFPRAEKVDIFGSVEDLSPFYVNATAVVSPIFVQGGMKTKVLDAMRFGKRILATPESLVGIEWKGVEGIYCCDSADAFVQAISGLEKSINGTFYESVQSLFQNKYSYQVKKDFYQNHLLSRVFANVE
nr:hypothetical protein HAGR004_14980 [Bdellovibrio sp. HAGR004]